MWYDCMNVWSVYHRLFPIAPGAIDKVDFMLEKEGYPDVGSQGSGIWEQMYHHGL